MKPGWEGVRADYDGKVKFLNLKYLKNEKTKLGNSKKRHVTEAKNFTRKNFKIRQKIVKLTETY